MSLDLLGFPLYFSVNLYQVQGGLAFELTLLIAIKITIYVLED